MNAEQLKKNLYQTVKIRPIAKRMESTGKILQEIDYDWMIRPAETGFVRLDNVSTKHSISLPNDSVKEFRAAGHLRLAVQLTLTERDVLIEPIWGG